MENKDITVSVVVCCYKSDYSKLFLTLKSIILQEGVIAEIIVTDDGTPNFDVYIIKNFFAKYSFTEYQILSAKRNRGTCANLLSGIQNAKFEYIKPISPGDLLGDKDVLYNWVSYMKEQNFDVCFSSAFYYRFSGQNLEFIKKKTNPQLPGLYCESRKANFYKMLYLVVYDPILGAATVIKKDIIEKYLIEVKGKIIYVEDSIYTLMLYDEIKFGFFSKEGIWYEYGSGISTAKEKFWVEKMNKDNNAMKEILILRLKKGDFFDYKMRLYLKYFRNDLFRSRAIQLILFPSSLYWKIKKAKKSSYTNGEPKGEAEKFFFKIVNGMQEVADAGN